MKATRSRSAYDSMGRRAYKKVTVNGSVTLHQRYIYRGYLQIACIDLTRSHHPALWYITWDATQPVATRPLAIQINGTWYTYGWDLTKNICELFSTEGRISTTYTYSPFGKVTASGSPSQPIQWSSEVWDGELGLVYYNWRYYNAMAGRWNSRDLIREKSYLNLFVFLANRNIFMTDILGLDKAGIPETYWSSTSNMPTYYPSDNSYNKTNKQYTTDDKETDSSILSTESLIFVDETTKIPYNANNSEYFLPANTVLNFSFICIRDTNSLLSIAYNIPITKIQRTIELLNKKRDSIGRRCFNIHLYSNPLSIKGYQNLPLPGYDIAYLLSHSSYIDKNTASCSYDKENNASFKFIQTNKRLRVFGCHLSGYPKGKISHTEALRRLSAALEDLHKYNNCPKTAKIQIVSALQ